MQADEQNLRDHRKSSSKKHLFANGSFVAKKLRSVGKIKRIEKDMSQRNIIGVDWVSE